MQSVFIGNQIQMVGLVRRNGRLVFDNIDDLPLEYWYGVDKNAAFWKNLNEDQKRSIPDEIVNGLSQVDKQQIIEDYGAPSYANTFKRLT